MYFIMRNKASMLIVPARVFDFRLPTERAEDGLSFKEFNVGLPAVLFAVTLTLTIRPARGFFSGILQQGYAFGYLLAAIVYGALFTLFPTMSWRVMFAVGVLP